MQTRAAVQDLEKMLATKYQVPPGDMEHAVLVFGTTQETAARMRDEHTRYNVCNPNNQLVVQIRNTGTHTLIHTTIHRPHDFETISVSHARRLPPPDPNRPGNEAEQ